MKKYLLIMQQNPYANSLALEALEFALALSSFNQTISLLFKGDGVLQLLAQPDTDKLVCKDFTRIYSDMKLFGIENIYIEETSMRNYAATDLLVQPKVVDAQEIVNIIKEHDILLTV